MNTDITLRTRNAFRLSVFICVYLWLRLPFNLLWLGADLAQDLRKLVDFRLDERRELLRRAAALDIAQVVHALGDGRVLVRGEDGVAQRCHRFPGGLGRNDKPVPVAGLVAGIAGL